MATDVQKLTKEDVASWYDSHHQLYGSYAECIRTLLETLIKGRDLPYHSITCRTKERQSFLKKWELKSYASCELITDFAGIRVIAYTTADVKRICDLIVDEFQCDRKNSVDKGREMQENQVGYLSVHYVVSLNQSREDLGEYTPYKGLKCEIQVRTLLQHAWAEIEHDRNYKFGGILPKDIRRRFYLVAGTLELMDQEFQNLSDAIDDYAQQVNQDTQQGNLDIPIDSISLAEFMRQKFPDLIALVGDNPDVIEELHDMGICTLSQLDELLSPKIVEDILCSDSHTTDVGLLRDVMILQDYKRYFETAWNRHWGCTDPESIRRWKSCGVDIDFILKRIIVEDNEVEEDHEET